MADEPEPNKKSMPKGGRKGGAVFPRHTLDEALGWAKKLVTKTHVEAQPVDVIFAGVVGARSGRGKVRISALKQYGLLKGDTKGYSASDAAKKLIAAPEQEQGPLKQEAMLRPTVFRGIYAAYHGDEVPKGKIKQRAAELNVHPDETDICADIYTSSLISSGLGKLEGDRVVHVAATGVALPPEVSDDDSSVQEGEPAEDSAIASGGGDETGEVGDGAADRARARAPRAVFNVNVNLDSSLDTEKLERQLALLKKYGAI